MRGRVSTNTRPRSGPTELPQAPLGPGDETGARVLTREHRDRDEHVEARRFNSRVLRGAGPRVLECSARLRVQRVPKPRNVPSRARLHSSTRTWTRPDPRLTSSPGLQAPRTAGFTLHRKWGEGVWPPTAAPSLPNVSDPGARPHLRPRVPAVRHLWLPVDTGVSRTHGFQGPRQQRLKEGSGGLGRWGDHGTRRSQGR